MNTVQPRNLRGASLRSTSLFRSSAWDAHSRRKPRGNGILQSLFASTMVTRVEMDEVVVTCNERARDGNVEHACARSWNARCTLARRNRPERLPGRRRRSPLVVGSPPRRLCPTTLSLSIRLESRGKNGWKSCTVYDRPIIGPVPVESVVSDPIYVAWTAGVGFLTIDRGENR